MKRILFSGDGSGGDLIPHVLMAQQFQQAGYEVCVCGSSEFSKIASDFGVPFEAYPHNYTEIYLENQRTGYIHNMRENIRHQEMLYQGEYELLSKIAPDYDVLINFLAEVFVPSAAEAFGLANIKLFTFPVIPSYRYAPPTGLPFITENRFLNQIQWQGAIVVAHMMSYFRTVNRLRAKLGLPPTHDLLGHNAHCDHMMIGLYEELMPPCPSWAKQVDYSYIGPILPRTDVSLSPELDDFISKGDPPIYIGFGSMRHAESDRITRQLLEAVEAVGVRAVLAQATSDIGAGLEESDRVYVLKEYPIPHHVLFPRLAGAVHHGSWITTHLAAQAGIPQFVIPQASDQYQWQDRVAKAGLGPKGADMNRLAVPDLIRGITALVNEPSYTANAKAFGERVAGIDGARNALELFERIKGDLPKRK